VLKVLGSCRCSAPCARNLTRTASALSCRPFQDIVSGSVLVVQYFILYRTELAGGYDPLRVGPKSPNDFWRSRQSPWRASSWLQTMWSDYSSASTRCLTGTCPFSPSLQS
jgi:hypothetical protein